MYCQSLVVKAVLSSCDILCKQLDSKKRTVYGIEMGIGINPNQQLIRLKVIYLFYLFQDLWLAWPVRIIACSKSERFECSEWMDPGMWWSSVVSQCVAELSSWAPLCRRSACCSCWWEIIICHIRHNINIATRAIFQFIWSTFNQFFFFFFFFFFLTVVGSSTCAVCLDRPANTLLRPCNHVCTCSTCARALSLCPLCRHLIEARETVYLSWV